MNAEAEIEVLEAEDGDRLWVSIQYTREDAAAAMTAYLDDAISPDDAIHPEDIGQIGMRPMTALEAELYGPEAEGCDIECALDDPRRTKLYWRWTG